MNKITPSAAEHAAGRFDAAAVQRAITACATTDTSWPTSSSTTTISTSCGKRITLLAASDLAQRCSQSGTQVIAGIPVNATTTAAAFA